MIPAEQISGMFSNISNLWFYILGAIISTIIIRVLLSCFKAWAIDNGEADDSDKGGEIKWRDKGFGIAFKHSFFSNAKDIRIDDCWLPALIGGAEIVIYPLLIAKGWVAVIGAWIVIKTASSWGGWQKTRTAYNRFLLGNIFSLIASWWMYRLFIKM